MTINFNLHKTLEVLSKIRLPVLTILIAFISSFNLWFLCIYFFHNSFIIYHGITITLLTTFALSISWCLIVGMSVPKFMIWFSLQSNPKILDEKEDEKEKEESKTTMNLFVFLEIIVLHGLFIYLEYLFHWTFKVFISVTFLFGLVQFFLIDYGVKSAYDEYHESQQQANQ